MQTSASADKLSNLLQHPLDLTPEGQIESSAGKMRCSLQDRHKSLLVERPISVGLRDRLMSVEPCGKQTMFC